MQIDFIYKNEENAGFPQTYSPDEHGSSYAKASSSALRAAEDKPEDRLPRKTMRRYWIRDNLTGAFSCVLPGILPADRMLFFNKVNFFFFQDIEKNGVRMYITVLKKL